MDDVQTHGVLNDDGTVSIVSRENTTTRKGENGPEHQVKKNAKPRHTREAAD